jgi:hypothetical protein
MKFTIQRPLASVATTSIRFQVRVEQGADP